MSLYQRYVLHYRANYHLSLASMLIVFTTGAFFFSSTIIHIHDILVMVLQCSLIGQCVFSPHWFIQHSFHNTAYGNCVQYIMTHIIKAVRLMAAQR